MGDESEEDEDGPTSDVTVDQQSKEAEETGRELQTQKLRNFERIIFMKWQVQRLVPVGRWQLAV